jgi:hypothetical protein
MRRAGLRNPPLSGPQLKVIGWLRDGWQVWRVRGNGAFASPRLSGCVRGIYPMTFYRLLRHGAIRRWRHDGQRILYRLTDDFAAMEWK